LYLYPCTCLWGVSEIYDSKCYLVQKKKNLE
jgi:hypothetical protein